MIQTGCKLPDEPIDDPVYNYETGMWYVGSLNTGGDARYVKGFIIAGVQYAFVASGNKGLEIINISDPAAPTLTYNYPTNGFARQVHIDSISSGKFLFLSDEVTGLYIFDISNPSSVILDTLIAYSGGVNSAYSKNGYLYVALKSGGVKILGINSLPGPVIEAGQYTSSHIAEHIEIFVSTMYLLEGANGFEIVNISDPVIPSYLAVYNTPGSCNDLKIGGEIAYIADGNSGVLAVSVSNPSQPVLLSITATETDTYGIEYSPNFMFTAENNFGARVFNLFNTGHPEAFGYFQTQGNFYSVNFFKGKVLVACGGNGLLILRF